MALLAALARMIGPLLLATLILEGGLLGWLVLAAGYAAAALLMTPGVRAAERRTTQRLVAGEIDVTAEGTIGALA
jgi:hypothetical protein